MTTASGTIRFHYDGTSTRVLYETDGNNNLLARYVYGPGDQLLAMVRGGVTYYYHYNGHGDVVALTDAAGAVVATYEYDAFGNHIATTGSVNNPYRYAGYRWDAETGLYYLNARYYAPSVGRFISRDAFHGFEDDPASLNQYNYARSNPVMFVDPSGYFATRLTHLYTGLRMLWDGLKGLFLVGILLANPEKIKIVHTVRALATAAIGVLGLQRYETVILTIGAILIIGAELSYNWNNLKAGISHIKKAFLFTLNEKGRELTVLPDRKLLDIMTIES